MKSTIKHNIPNFELFIENKKMKSFLRHSYENTKNSSQIFLFYPKLFASYFGLLEDKCLDKFCVGVYLLYLSMKMLRNTDRREKSSELLATKLFSESINVLTDVFGEKSKFWLYWNKRIKDYYRAIKYKECLNQEVIVNELTHIQIMDFELSFGKLAIDGLHFLSNETHCAIYESILKSETQFSRSLRMYADVKSYGKNKCVGQFDLISHFMDKDFDFRRKQLGIEECVKLIYIKRIAQNLLKMALENIQKALAFLKNFESTLCNTVLEETYLEIEFYLNTTEEYMFFLEEKVREARISNV